MAKKKQDDPPKGSPAWMATFSDLMNLLLCFFVLLFSMSSVDANKWEEVVASMTSAFSVFNEGSTSIGDGTLIGMGTTQLSNLDEYFSSMGQSATDKGEDPRDTSDQSGEGKTEDPQNGEGKTENPNDGEGSLEKQLEEANRKETETMLDSVSELTEIYNISGLLEVGMDPNGKYIELTINGSVLFDSGKAELKKEGETRFRSIGYGKDKKWYMSLTTSEKAAE